jgi:hypothetical protein
MAIKQIGGKNVYVIEAAPVETARASNGVGYAQIVSQQRWKIWEEAEKAVKDQMEFEKMTYQSQLDIYEKEKADLNRMINKAKELKLKRERGEISDEDYKTEKLRADIEYRNASLQQKRDLASRDKVIKTPVFDSFGDPVTDPKTNEQMYKITRISYNKPGTDQPAQVSAGKIGQAQRSPEEKSPEVKALEDEWIKKEAEGRAAAKKQGTKFDLEAWKKGAGKEIEDKLTAERAKQAQPEEAQDQELSSLIDELEAQRASLVAPGPSFDTNVLSRKRETFGGMAGVGGLGFAPRREKISPIYDEARAREAIAAASRDESQAIALSTAKRLEQKRAALLAAKEKEKQNRMKRIAELEVLVGTEDPANKEFQKLVSAEIERLKAIPTSISAEDETVLRQTSEQEAMKEFREGMLEAGPGPRTAASFMTRQPPEVPRPEDPERPRRSPRPERKPRDRNFIEGMQALLGEGIEPVSFGSASAESGLSFGQASSDISPSAPDGASMVPAVSNISFGVPTPSGIRKPAEAGLGMTPMDQPAAAQPAPQPAPQPSPQPQPQPAPVSPEVRKDFREDATSESKEAKRAKAANELYVQYAPRTYNEQTGEETLYELNPLEKEKIFQLYLQKSEEKMMTQQEGIAWYLEAIKKIKAEGSSGSNKKLTRDQKYASNVFKIIQEGKNLADKPAKLARIAKLDNDNAERPQHIVLVDKIYEINKAKKDVFNLTFKEISRVLEKDVKKKEQALQYLVAKSLLELDKA